MSQFRFQAQVAAAYDKDAEAPRWFQYLTEVFPDKGRRKGHDPSGVLRVHHNLPDCRYQKCLFLRRNGRRREKARPSTPSAMLGQENVSSLTIHDITERFQLSSLENKLANVATEINTKDPTSSEFSRALWPVKWSGWKRNTGHRVLPEPGQVHYGHE